MKNNKFSAEESFKFSVKVVNKTASAAQLAKRILHHAFSLQLSVSSCARTNKSFIQLFKKLS